MHRKQELLRSPEHKRVTEAVRLWRAVTLLVGPLRQDARCVRPGTHRLAAPDGVSGTVRTLLLLLPMPVLRAVAVGNSVVSAGLALLVGLSRSGALALVLVWMTLAWVVLPAQHLHRGSSLDGHESPRVAPQGPSEPRCQATTAKMPVHQKVAW